MLARFHGGPLNGQEAYISDDSVYVVMPRTATTLPVRYKLADIDPQGVANFFVVGIGPPINEDPR